MRRGDISDALIWAVALFMSFTLLASWYLQYGVVSPPKGFNISNTSLNLNIPSVSLGPGVNITIDKTIQVDYVDALGEILKMPLRINETAFENRTYGVPFVYYDYYSPYSFKDVLRQAISLNASKVSRHAYEFVNMMADIYYLYISGFHGNALTEVDYPNITHLEFSMMNPYTNELDPSRVRNGFNLSILWQDPSKVPLNKITLPYPVWSEYKSYSLSSKREGYYKIVYGVSLAWWGDTKWNYGYYREPEDGWSCWTVGNSTVCRVWHDYYSDITGKAIFYKAVYDPNGKRISYSTSPVENRTWRKDTAWGHYLYSPFSSNCWVDFWTPRYYKVLSNWSSGNTSYYVIGVFHNSSAKSIETQEFTEYDEARKFTFKLHFVLHDGNISSIGYKAPDVPWVNYSYTLNYPDFYLTLKFTGDAYHWANGSVHTIPLGWVYDRVKVGYIEGDKRYYNLGNLTFKVRIYKIEEKKGEVKYGIKLVDIKVHPTIPPEWVKDKPSKLPLEYYEQLQTYGYYKAVSDALWREAIDDADFVNMVFQMWEQINIVQSDEDFIDDQWIPLIRKTDTNNYGSVIFAQALLQGQMWTNTFEYDNKTKTATVYKPPAVDKETYYFIMVMPAYGGADDWILNVTYYDPVTGYGHSTAGITAFNYYWLPFYVFWASSDVGWPEKGVIVPMYRGFPFWTKYIGVKWRVRDVYVKEPIEVSGSLWEG
ncbi:protein of unknown function (plasmid) [Thermococcus nautili]|uniref:hypothetical protein n=1 Tax=Thermococcus nautili TaxID=195522 RepID=UPI0025557105|nr:hypothetical protein [Thermococcus nautili]CAI1494130.1 protein of unknown function [Thermococcus nautili]